MNNEFENNNGFPDDGYKAEDDNNITPDHTSEGASVDNAVNFIISNIEENKAEAQKDEFTGAKVQTADENINTGSTGTESTIGGSAAYAGANSSSAAYSDTGSTYRYAYNPYTESQTQNRNYSYQYQQAAQPVHEEPQMKKTKKNKKSRPTLRKAVMCAGFAVIFGVVASVGFQVTNFIGDKISPRQNAAETIPQVNVGDSDNSATGTSANKTSVTDVTKVVNAVMPSIVSITNVSEQQIPNFFGGSQSQESKSSGTGIIVGQNDNELLIATNNHVVSDSKTLTVVFDDEKTAEATIKGTDAAKDLAVIAVKKKDISDDTMKKIKVATLGDSKTLKVGEPAIAIGNALGYGQSVTTGVISALDREVTVENITNKLIQTDAAINPGNSGGALLNTKGEVIGINAAKFSSNGVEGMGYAIPISDATPILNKLMTKTTREKVGENEQGYIGIKGANVTQEFSEVYGFPTGAYVSQVTKGGAAEDAGIERGDIIVEFDGTTIDSMETLQNTLQYYKKGEKVKVKIQTPNQGGDYKEKTVTVKLGEKPEE